jgi:hypothetical protein
MSMTTAPGPFLEVVREGLSRRVDGRHLSDTLEDDAVCESRLNFPGYSQTIRGAGFLVL